MRCAPQFAGIGIALAIALIPPAQAAEDGLPALPPNPTELAGALLRSGRVQAAREAFSRAAAADPQDARAWWGLGRIEQLYFREDAARTLMARAFRLDPRDPELVLSYLEFVKDPRARAVLLGNLLALTRTNDPRRASQAQARLQIEERMAGREEGALASDYTRYRLPLSGFRPGGALQHGWTVTARVNGGRPLRLVVDTGARGIVLHKTAGRELGLEALVASQIAGLGTGGATDSSLMRADTVAFGGLKFRDCLIEVTEARLAADADGVLGPSLFDRFLVRIDPRTRTLELTPREETAAAHTEPGALNLGGGLLLVPGRMAVGREGWFLLDTGAAFTAIASDSVPAGLRAGPVSLFGAEGDASAFRLSPISLHVAGRQVADREAIALDLGALSRREGIEISGLLGYSTLSRWPLTIDFHTGLVRLGD